MTQTRDTHGTLRVAPPIAPPIGLVRAEPGTGTGFVGRGDELMLLDAIYMMMLGGRRQIVFIEGDIGTGKTALIDAFVARVAAQHAWPAFVSSSPQTGQGHGHTRHAALSSVPLSLGASRLLAEDLVALGADRPVLLVLEDLHAADLALLDLVNRLAHGDDALHLMVIASARPEACALSLLAKDLVEQGLARTMRLGPMSLDEVRLYLGEHAPHRMGESRALMQRSAGHPGAIAEVVLDAAVDVPDALRNLVAHQLARITPAERRVLFIAAEADETFSAIDLAAELALDADEVDLTCDGLAEDGDFLVAGPIAHAPDGRASGSYRFLHPAVRALFRHPAL